MNPDVRFHLSTLSPEHYAVCGLCKLPTVNNLQAKIDGVYKWICVSCEPKALYAKEPLANSYPRGA